MKRTFLLVIGIIGFLVLSAGTVQAATRTVCASGCDHTTIANAFSAAAEGDIIEVNGGGGSPYAASADTGNYNLTFPSASTTLSCVNGATIGQTDPTGNNSIYMSTSSTIMGCTLSNVFLSAANVAPAVSGIRIVDNIFSNSATSSIIFGNNTSNYTISGNTNINYLGINTSSTYGTIDSNTFYGRMPYGQGAIVTTNASTTNVTFSNNTFTNYSSDPGSSNRLLLIDGEDITFTTNTIRYATGFSGTNVIASLALAARGAVNVHGNYIEAPVTGNICLGMYVYSALNQTWAPTYTISHNTIFLRGSCSGMYTGLSYGDSYGTTSIDPTFELHYNLVYNNSGVSASGIKLERQPSSAALTQSNSYNVAYPGFDNVVITCTGSCGTTSLDVSTNSTTTNPFLKLGDVDTTNDMETAPFSPMLDVNGTEDIGATSQARVSTIEFDDNGTIDYSSVHATSTYGINDFVRSGDTLNFAAGSYSAFALNSTAATTSLTIAGAGASTIFTAGADQNALSFTGVTTSTLSNVYLTGASTSPSSSYLVSKILMSYGGNDYDATADIGEAANSMLVLPAADDCSPAGVSSDGFDLSEITSGGTDSFNIALVDLGGSKLTFLVPNSVASSGGDIESICGGVGASVDVFLSGVFTASSGNYTYNSSVVSGAGAALLAGVTDPPTISRNYSYYAGLKLANSSGWTLSGVTSTGNSVGYLISGTSGDNTLSESELSSNSDYDIVSTAATTNTVSNVSFTRTSTLVSDALGALWVKFKARAKVTRTDGSTAISGAYVTSTDAGDTDTDLSTTDGSGFTSFATLPAYRITSASSAVTNGGWNPYSFAATSTGYTGNTSSTSLTTRNQTVYVTLASTSVPTAPSNAATSTVGSTTSTFTWDDNSGDEDHFIVEYRDVYAESFPGTSVEVAADAVSTVITGLTPNTYYEFRVAAVSLDGVTSTYSTSDPFYTLAATPAAPTVSAASRTSITVSINTNSNSTSTEYALYSSTLGAYLQADGTTSASPSWNTTSTWGTLTVSGLTCNTSYSVTATARNAESVETAASSEGTATTSACASSGGGGGGGTSASGSSGLPATGYAPTPVTTLPVSSNVTSLPSTSGETTQPVPEAPVIAPSNQQPSAITRTQVSADAKAFSVTLPPSAQADIASFIEFGTGSTDVDALGTGERRAVVRDALEIMQGNINIQDLARIASGQIPVRRNLAQEQKLVPRALATFRTIYGHAPNFKDEGENLAWNTLIYRLRFDRNLTQEKSGIQEFRRLFNRSPQDPFQWSVVRVLGYIR